MDEEERKKGMRREKDERGVGRKREWKGNGKGLSRGQRMEGRGWREEDGGKGMEGRGKVTVYEKGRGR